MVGSFSEASATSQRRLVRRKQEENEDGTTKDMYLPGTPIGYLAARGTPYEKKYFTRRLGACCLFVTPFVTIVVAAIALVPVLYAIANHALHTANFIVQQSNITSPENTTFSLTLLAQVKKVGIFPAHIYFREPIDVYWNRPAHFYTESDKMDEIHLGTFRLAHLGAAAGHASVNQATQFNIDDEDGFGSFAAWLVSKEEFTWRIKSKNLHVEAFSFLPTYKSLDITKDIVIKGINNFNNDVQLLDLQLPGDDPQGGIQAIATAKLFNPSPFGIEVGTLELDLFYKGLYLGPVSVDGLNILAGDNVVTLHGRVLPYSNNQTALEILGGLFTNYINSIPSDVVAQGRSVRESDGNVVSWLAKGIPALAAHINFVPPQPIDPIKGISIDTLNLVYNEQLPYNPTLSSNDLRGFIILPFGFSLNITQLATQLNLYLDGTPVGTATGEYAESNTDIQARSIAETSGEILLSLPPTMLVLPNNTDEAKKQFVLFENELVFTEGTAFQAVGAAKALTDTPLGKILLDGIKFNVTTGLVGLSGLTKYPTIINSVDVVGSSGADAIDLMVGLTVVNPSNLNLTTGDANLELINQLPLGVSTLPNLNLVPGRNDIMSRVTFDPNRDPIGIETLNRFISGLETNLNASGFDESSKVASLQPSLSKLRLKTVLPALTSSLVKAANLTVLDSTGVVNDIANSIVQLANPFSSDLTITSISANASSLGVYLANINTALQFTAKGKATTSSPNVPLAINLYPPDLFALLRAYAIESGQDPAYIDGLVNLAGLTLSTTESPTRNQKRSTKVYDDDDDDDDDDDSNYLFEGDSAEVHAQLAPGSNPGVYFATEDPEDIALESHEGIAKKANFLHDSHPTLSRRSNLYTGFELPPYVLKAFSVAKLDLTIVANTIIGEYGTTLTFSQNDVALGTDESLLKLLPVVAGPIVQRIVDAAVLNIDRVTITEARPSSFTAMLQGALTNSGPFDATVSFPKGLDIYWEGRLLTSAGFPNISLVGDVGSSLNVQIEGAIPDVQYFTTFLQRAIKDPSFVWSIRASGIVISAIGIDVPDISLTKDVQLTGLNSLKGQVIINSFDVPSNDPAGGLHLTAESTINNPAQVGVALSTFGININLGETQIGPASANGAFTLQALAVTSVPLVGRIQQQSSDQGLSDLSTLFTKFVHNQNVALSIQGTYAGPSDVVWLNEGIKALTVGVILPSQQFEVIRVISLNQLALYFTAQTAWSPRTDSSNTTANFFLPFAFPLDITAVQGPFISNYQDADMAVLNIPRSSASTDVEARILTLAFDNVPFSVYNQAHNTFSQFVADFVKQEMIQFKLHGSATASTNTAAGALTISDIPFDLNTNLLGLQNLNARPANVSNLDVFHGYPTFLQINVDTTLFNPSDTTVGAGDVTFAVMFEGQVIGDAIIKNILLSPGANQVPTEIHFAPVGAESVTSGQHLLENYVSNVTSDATVAGTSQTTSIQSLVQGLGQISLNTLIPALDKLLVTSTFLSVPNDIAQTGRATVTVTLANPFTASIHLLKLHALADYQGIIIGTIDEDLAAEGNIINAPGHTTIVSQEVPIQLDINAKVLLRFIMAAAKTAGVSLGPLPPFFQQVLDLPGDGSTQVIPVPDSTEPPCNSGRAFDTLGAILELLKPLTARIPINSTLKLDDYQTNLDFVQNPVPVQTDKTALNLVGPAAAPLIQLIVDQSVLTVEQANATSLTNQGFITSLSGQLKADIPADAYIEFPDGLSVGFQGNDIASLSLPPLCASPPDGIPLLKSEGQLTIKDEGAFEEFTYYLLTEPNFQWRLHSDTVVVRALGIQFSNVKLDKTIQLDGFNGLSGISISRFETTGDAPGRINIKTTAEIPSPASLGVELGTASFELYFQGSDVGTITSDYLFLAPKATTPADFTGFLKSQKGSEDGLKNIGILFSQYLSGQNSTLSIHGVEVIGPASDGQPVKWLTAAFKRFVTSAVLPGQIYKIIYAITLSDLEVFLTNPDDSYTVPSNNKHTEAIFANPLVFSLQVLSLQPSIKISYEGADTATLDISMSDADSGTSTGPNDHQSLSFGFQDQNLVALDHASFQAFFAKLTDTESANFELTGTTSVVARTQIGDPTITGIQLNVSTTLKGINSFNHQMKLVNSSVDDPTPQYLGTHLTAIMENPSNLTVHSTDVSLPTIYDKYNVDIGRAVIPKLDLLPGSNDVPVLFQLVIDPYNSSEVQEVITLYVSASDLETRGKTNIIPLDVKGQQNADPALSPYDSLNPALAGISATTSLEGIGSLVINAVRVYIPLSAIVQEFEAIIKGGGNVYVYSFIDFRNDLPSGLDFHRITTFIKDATDPDAGEYARLEVNFGQGGEDPFTLPPAPSTNHPDVDSTTAPIFPNILLPKGLLGSVPLIGHNLNLENYIRVDLTGPNGSYYLPGLHYVQNNVPTKYFIGTGEDAGIEIDALGSLLDILNKLTGNELEDIISQLAKLDPSNTSGIFGKLGEDIQNFFCKDDGILGAINDILGQDACGNNTSTTSSSSASPNILSSIVPSSSATSIAPTSSNTMSQAPSTMSSSNILGI